MNKITTILSATVLLGSVAQAQFIVEEDFEGAGIPAGFTAWVQGGGVTANWDQAAPANRPTMVPSTGNASSGDTLQLDIAGDGSNGGFYVTVSLTENRLYQVDAATRSTDDPTSHWEEIFITPTQPVNGIDVVPGPDTILIGKNSSWVCEDWDNTLLTSCDFGGTRTFTAPSTGTFYVVFKTGVCCGGGPATVTLDEFTVEDVGGAMVFDNPPTPFSEDFEDGDLINNYGGMYGTFAGGDPGGVFTGQDDRIGATVVANGNGGGNAIQLKSSTNLEGANFIFYGLVVELDQNPVAPTDLTGFNSLRFDARLGDSANPINFWNVRIEDTAAAPTNNLWNFVRLGENPFVGDPAFPDEVPNSMPLTTSWQTFIIPLTQFQDGQADGGLRAPQLENAKNIVFVSEDGANPYLPDSLNVDLLIDNIVLSTDSNVADWQLF